MNKKISASQSISYPIRINRYLSLQKYCSRRAADHYIEKGLVKINDHRAKLGDQVEKNDIVSIDQMVRDAREDRLYLACYKPLGVVSHNPQKGEVDIVKAIALPSKWKKRKLAPLGRLDKNSRGLMILSDDGRIVAPLLGEGNAHEKEYVVTVDKKVLPGHVMQMKKGVRIERYTTKPAEVTRINKKTFRIILREGKKHQIRRMCAALGYQVQDLERVRIKNVLILNLKPGKYRELQGDEKRDFLSGLL